MTAATATKARQCARCNEPLLSQDGRRRFCSVACASATRLERQQEAARRACKRCRKPLPDDHHLRRYCSVACWTAAYNVTRRNRPAGSKVHIRARRGDALSPPDCCPSRDEAELIPLAAALIYGEEAVKDLEWVYGPCDCHSKN